MGWQNMMHRGDSAVLDMLRQQLHLPRVHVRGAAGHGAHVHTSRGWKDVCCADLRPALSSCMVLAT